MPLPSSSSAVSPQTLKSSPRGRFIARVLRNELICAEHYRLVLELPAFPPSRPGQFVQVNCNADPALLDHASADVAPRELEWPTAGMPPVSPLALHDPDFTAPHAYLRRPFSLAARRDLPSGQVQLDIIQRLVGKGTHYLAALSPGAELALLGPLGNGFTLPETLDLALLVGGGVGIPPMFYLADTLRRAGKRAIGLVGAQRRDLVPLTFPPDAPAPSPKGDPLLNAAEFAQHGFPTIVTTDDGSLGMKGFVTAALRRQIETELRRPGGLRPDRMAVYCCGPTPMMRATAEVCRELGVTCQVSLEQPMACGMGTCQSCVIRWKPLDGRPVSGMGENGWVYKLTCKDGPVFDAREIVWEKPVLPRSQP